jgi:hypothetical protein
MSRLWRFAVVLSLLAGCALIVLAEPPARLSEQRRTPSQSALTVDNTTYINANNILMFVTNHGNFGRDLWGGNSVHGIFGNDYGTYYPYSSVENIRNGVDDRSVLYAAGLWIGGVDSATNDTLVTVSEYSSEYVPGPMEGGTFQPDRPEFRVYKLYRDSLESNPNQDYLEWPIDQGAPVDGEGHPAMRGDQMLWTVYNDADSAQHDNNCGETEPLGIEIQQTVWASDESGEIELPNPRRLLVTGPTDSTYDIEVDIKDYAALNGHDYVVVTDTSTAYGFVWHLIDVTTGDTLLANQTEFLGANLTVTDGFLVQVQGDYTFASFEVVANGAGPLDPPVPGALAFAGFPTPGNADPDDNQQVGPAIWAIHTGDNGGSSGGGTRASYAAFLERVFRNDPARKSRLGGYIWEMRFTGSNDYPGVGGSWAWDAFVNGDAYWVPFELWRSGINTPEDPSDDLRLTPWVWGDIMLSGGGDNLIFDLSQYGSNADGSCHDGCEHSASANDNDPYTDWIYWRIPLDTTAGQAGYLEFEEAMKTDPANWPGNELPVIDRFVLINWNGGVTPPFNQDLPEQGTVFRLRAQQPVPGLTFAFRADQTPVRTSGPLGLGVYLKYKLINKGARNLKDCFVSIWSDPDLGQAGDDLVGCDSLYGRFFCYNASWDNYYGTAIPAVGFKLLEGPVVPSLGDTAHVDGFPLADYRNLRMYSFNRFVGADDPDNYSQSYCLMRGLDPKNHCIPYINPTTGQPSRYQRSGDPVTGTGWLDDAPDDRRMMASFGPFDFRPGDTQHVLIKLAVGQGADHLTSLTSLREILEYNPDITDVDDEATAILPLEFRVHQNYPNPFNPATVIRYSLPARLDVEVSVFNVLGQRVVTLVQEAQPAGEHAVVWYGTDAANRAVASGVYFYRVHAGEEIQTRKMMLLK